jgi:lysophospholipase L1-like esterase
MKCSFALAPILCTLFAVAPGAAGAGADVAPTDLSLLYIGRWDKTDPSVYHGHWVGAYLRTGFNGKSVSIKLAQPTDLVVSIDGEATRVVRGEKGTTRLEQAPLVETNHALMVGVKGGGGILFEGLELDAGAATRPPAKRPLIECIGDSISCGTPGRIEAAGNYNWVTAEALGCDHTQIAWPARALTTGYGCADDKAGLDTQYFQLAKFGDQPRRPWDFSYTPDVILINLGQNDNCGQEPVGVFLESYIKFLRKLRDKFPHVQIFGLRPLSGYYAASVRAAVETLYKDGDSRVHFVDTTGWLLPTDFKDGVHPDDHGNLKMAEKLAPIIKPFVPLVAGSSSSNAATVGDPADPAALGKDVEDAYISGARRIVIKPGIYQIPAARHPAIKLDHWQDATLIADGVTLINPVHGQKMISMHQCANTTVQGATLTQSWMSAYQGQISSVARQNNHCTCDWKPSAGYPVPPEGLATLWIDVIDGHTHHIKLGFGDFYHSSLQSLGNGVFRSGVDDHLQPFAVGDWVVARYEDPAQKVFIDECRDCTIRNITMMRNGFAPIFENAGGGNHILNCTWTQGHRPEGATDDPLVTNAADGIHSACANPGPDIENCTFRGVFLDDCIAIHGAYQDINQVDGPVLLVHNGYALLTVGEPVQIANERGFFVQTTVSALKDNHDGTSTVTLPQSVNVSLPAKICNPLHAGAGYKIIGCHLGDTRSRGILVKGDNGLIRDNVIEQCGMAAIAIGPEYGEGESGYCNHVLVEANTCRENGRVGYDPALWVHGDSARENHDITIRNNHFISNCAGDVVVEYDAGATVTGNTFTSPAAWPPGEKPRHPIELGNAIDVTISDNALTATSIYAEPLIHLRANTSSITQEALKPEPVSSAQTH